MDNLKNLKQIILIASVAAALGIIGLLIYLFLPSRVAERKIAPGGRGIAGRIPSVEEPAPNGELGGLTPGMPSENGPSPITEAGRLVRLTDFSVVSPSLNQDESRVLFYKKDGGDLSSSDFNGASQEKISNITIVGITEAIWSPSRDRAAVFYLDDETLKSFLHRSTTSVAVLPQNLASFSWSPDGKNVAYIESKNERVNLVMADAAGKNAKAIATTPLRDAKIRWITADRVAFQTPPSGLAEGFLFIFSRSAGTFNKIAGPLFGLMSTWSGDGSRVLVSSTGFNGSGLKLVVLDASGKLIFDTGVGTLATKCVFAGNQEVFCALPRALTSNSVMPDDYLRGDINTLDKIVRINVDKKEVTEVFGENSFDAEQLIITKNRDYLFFVNRTDGTLWSIKLK